MKKSKILKIFGVSNTLLKRFLIIKTEKFLFMEPFIYRLWFEYFREHFCWWSPCHDNHRYYGTSNDPATNSHQIKQRWKKKHPKKTNVAKRHVYHSKQINMVKLLIVLQLFYVLFIGVILLNKKSSILYLYSSYFSSLSK